MPAPLRQAIWVVMLGSAMSMLDTTIVNIALRALSLDLHASLAVTQWVLTAYLLGLAAVTPVAGWAAERFGARRTYITALSAFSVASALCGLSSSMTELIAFRALQGAAGGLMIVGQIILMRAAGKANAARAMSAVGAVMMLSPLAGPVLGGLLLDTLGWRWIFFVNLVIGMAAVPMAIRCLRPDGPRSAGRLDVTGLVLAVGGAVAVTYGLAEVGVSGHGPAAIGVSLGAGAVLLAAFAWHASRLEKPLLDVRLFTRPVFAAATLAMFCLGATVFGSMILMPLYFQVARHQDAIATGLLLAPQGAGAAIALVLSARLTDRAGAGRTALLGAAINILATLPLITIGASTSYVLLCATLVIRGFGFGLSAMPAMTAAFRSIDPAKISDATPLLNFLQRVGGSAGTAVIAVVLQARLSRTASAAGQAHAFAATFLWALGLTVAAALPVILLARHEPAPEPASPAADRRTPLQQKTIPDDPR
jgi:EmrB/QacA subfamily drug resistance transporter